MQKLNKKPKIINLTKASLTEVFSYLRALESLQTTYPNKIKITKKKFLMAIFFNVVFFIRLSYIVNMCLFLNFFRVVRGYNGTVELSLLCRGDGCPGIIIFTRRMSGDCISSGVNG